MVFDEQVEIDKVRNNKCQLITPLMYKEQMNKDPYVYQYRTLDSFWLIIESDSFWATNARFSNDHEEQSLGMKKLQEVLCADADLVDSPGDCYIVCFCDEDDKLSQWRGYAQEGVSIGFDLNNIRPFYIKSSNGKTCRRIYNSCYKVQYIDEQTTSSEFARKFKLDFINDQEAHKDIVKKALDIIPYVKHQGFYEEAESRLVFYNRDNDLADYICYRKIGNIQAPYIVVKAGAVDEEKKEECVIRLNLDKHMGPQWKKELERQIAADNLHNMKVICCTEDDKMETDDSMCYGCTLRNTYIPGNNYDSPICKYAFEHNGQYRIDRQNEIYLSDSKNQEKTYQLIYSFLKEKKKADGIPIWCEGHLPIRKITVGSMSNKEIVRESIKHYCKQHYWLNSVKVSCSNTPYRSSLI